MNNLYRCSKHVRFCGMEAMGQGACFDAAFNLPLPKSENECHSFVTFCFETCNQVQQVRLN